MRFKQVVWLWAALAGALLAALPAAAGKEGGKSYVIQGYLESDLRLAMPSKDSGGIADLENYNFLRSDNTLRLKGTFTVTPKVKGVVDGRLVFTGMMAGETLSDLSWREKVDPFRLENDALYVQVLDFVFPGLDLRVGRQVVVWGTGDKFNPTNNLNPVDLEDPVSFGEAIANEMIVLSYTPPTLARGEEEAKFEDLTVQLAVVPLFRPAQLPPWSKEAFVNPALFKQQVHDREVLDLVTLQQAFAAGGGLIEYDVNVRRPDVSITNVQVGLKIDWVLLGVDMSVSYFRGFDDMPVPERVYAGDMRLPSWPATTGTSLEELIMGADVWGATIANDITLSYPRMQVFGADFSTSIDRFGGLGLWGEVAFVLHPARYYQIRTSGAWAPGMGGKDVYIPVDRTFLARDLQGTWFWKLTAGIDYSIFSWWYINVQYLHGMVDEFGTENLHDYAVAGSDFKFFDDKLLLRLFAIVCLNKHAVSAVIYPELKLAFWRNASISLGGLAYAGGFDSKFGTPLAGPAMVFVKGRISI